MFLELSSYLLPYLAYTGMIQKDNIQFLLATSKCVYVGCLVLLMIMLAKP